MKPKHRRLAILAVALVALGGATSFVLAAFDDNLVFFYSPTQIEQRKPAPDRRFRLGGLVEKGTVTKLADGVTTRFTVTDLKHQVAVEYRGVLPDLFREGQGVVAEGHLRPGGVFVASEVLAKHDERYMPPEVAQALKASGEWHGAEAASQVAR